MKLARFIQTNMERLLKDWEEVVLEIAPELKGEGSFALRDHAREMLDFIYKKSHYYPDRGRVGT